MNHAAWKNPRCPMSILFFCVRFQNTFKIDVVMPNLAIGSAEDLPPRFRANPRRNARTPPGLRPVPRGSGNLRADSTERSADSAGLRVETRADPRVVRRELAEEFTRKMSADKNLSFTNHQ